MWILITLGTILIILFFISFGLYQAAFGHREEVKPGLKYFTVEEFEGTIKEPFTFKSCNININGFIYRQQNNIVPKGIVVVVHGMGGGHINYMNEICYFAGLGYKVYAYDNHGTMASEGKNLRGFEQAVIDLRNCLLNIQSDSNNKDLKIVLYGHSWGAYTVSNVLNYDDVQVDGVISLASFNNPTSILVSMVRQQLGSLAVLLYPFIKIIEFIKFGKVCFFTSLKGYKKAKCPILLIHGEKDLLVPVSIFRNYRKELNSNNQIEFIELPTKYHRPNLTDEGVIYDNWFNNEITKINKEKGDLKEFFEKADYNLLTKFDNRVMDRVKDFVARIM